MGVTVMNTLREMAAYAVWRVKQDSDNARARVELRALLRAIAIQEILRESMTQLEYESLLDRAAQRDIVLDLDRLLPKDKAL